MVEKTRVDFNAPVSLVQRADALAAILDTSRTHILKESLRKRLDDLANDEEIRHVVREAYYEDRIELDTVRDILGTDEAMRLRVLRNTIHQELPEPEHTGELPSAEEFYDGEIPEWIPEDEEDEIEPLV